MRPDINHEPDFNRFLDTLLLRKAWTRPPQFDFHIDITHRSEILGRPCVSPADEVEVFRLCGYDYVQAKLYPPMTELYEHQDRQRLAAGADTHSGAGVMPDYDTYKARRWSWHDMAEGKLDAISDTLDFIEQMAEATPPNTKLLVHIADIFTFSWEMIGFDAFCFASIEQPEWIEDVMGSLAAAIENAFQAILERVGDRAGAVLYSDDIAYTEGLMLSPDFFRENLFPHIARLINRAKARNLPLIYHSDGKLYDVFDDLAAIGVKGIQPLEPKSMDPLEIQKGWPGRFCLLGNIDLDLMARGTPDQVEAAVRNRIDTLNTHGGYIPGISNTVPDYVRIENYCRMIETIKSYPDEPIPENTLVKASSA
ncbi:uroporphyrinogen decarboxylase family protein [Mucisphaera calidilacus]|uniref:Methylcobalamin:coenzyme M methyltransferase n=1 Tax=Mucisphaera calidilacus TaxID=2527982 RepID=A0A518BWW9_9BACT|nr:uroporphyrinogen decarboxylase family protein [Mucisphaera calidilacus]QDU71434.1 methylcobalamin:coenzyme M methyltransferase [Mucisphaera calidilacus]